jgi:hypothetical protein
MVADLGLTDDDLAALSARFEEALIHSLADAYQAEMEIRIGHVLRFGDQIAAGAKARRM